MKKTLFGILALLLIIGYYACKKEENWLKRIHGSIVCCTDDKNLAVITESGLRKIELSHNSMISSPRWSPDGTKIAYVQNIVNDYNINIINSDGTGDTSIFFGEYHSPMWTKNGSKIVFCLTSFFTGDSGIYISQTDGTNIQLLVSTNSVPRDWFPNGQKILIERYNLDSEENEICILDITENQIEYIGKGRSARLSPDGNKIVYKWEDDIYLMDLNDKSPVRLTHSEGGDYTGFPAWSPAGDMIVYTNYELQNVIIGTTVWEYLYIMNPDGSGKTKLDFGSDVHLKRPDWRN